MRIIAKNNGTAHNETGYILVSVLILLAIAAITISGSLQISSATARNNYGAKIRSLRYYESEEAVGRTVSWLRLYSQQMVEPFRRDIFYSRFDRTSPTLGDNEGALFSVPTNLKLSGTNNSAILHTASELGTAKFSATEDIITGTPFPVVTTFSAAIVGNSWARVTLVDALPVDPTKDYGPPPNPTPETDFYPVYRIDAMTGDDRGSQVYATVIGHARHLYDYGIYGQDYLEIRQQCDSYNSATGTYGPGTRRPNCAAGSNSTSAIHQTEEVYGTLQTNGEIDNDNPYGGDVCADFAAGCPNKGETCAGEDCGVPLLEFYDPWDVYCPAEKPAVVVAASGPLNIVDSVPADDDVLPVDRCWDSVTVNNNVTLTLSSTNSPYYIETLRLMNNSNSRLNINPSPAGGIVELYVKNIVGDAFNGNQMINATGRPFNFRMHYLGTNALTLNGTAAMNVALVAPNATVTVSGSFNYQGALLAKQLYLTGSGSIHYDESLGGNGVLSDVQYRIKDLVQVYR